MQKRGARARILEMILQANAEAEYDERLDRCPLCESRKLRPFDRDRDGHIIDTCRGCGVRFMNPQYSDRDREELYSRYITFHDSEPPEGEIPMRKWRWVRQECKRRNIQMIERFMEKGRLLSVGCGDGVEIEVGQELGWTDEGYDVDAAATAEVARRYSAVVHSGEFASLRAKSAPFDAILMDQVIEHLKDPGDYLRNIFDMLRPGGVLFLGMPNLNSFSNRAKTLMGKFGLKGQKRGRHYAFKHHIFFFSPGVLRRILERYGFEVLCIRGSLKPQKKKLTPVLSRWFPNVDSGFISVARKPKG